MSRAGSLLCLRSPSDAPIRIVAADGKFEDRRDQLLDRLDDPATQRTIETAFEQQADNAAPLEATLYLSGPAWDSVVHLASRSRSMPCSVICCGCSARTSRSASRMRGCWSMSRSLPISTVRPASLRGLVWSRASTG
ncbi:MAG: hypothetical protein WDN69_09600 [Aliidongia sp.]